MATEPNHEKEHPRSAEIKDALRRILRSAPFQGSKQSQTLLEYLVEHSLAGHDDELKERIIGVEVFGRKSDYDTTVDAIVRARAGEVRKRLAQYYTSEAGQDSAVRIVITPGSYRPSFVHRHGANGGSEESRVRDRSEASADPGTQGHAKPETDLLSVPGAVPGLSNAPRWRLWGIVAVAAGAVLLVAWTGISRWTKSELDIFWGPFLDSKTPVVVYTGTIPTYALSTEAFEKSLSVTPDNQNEPFAGTTLPTLTDGQVLTSKDVNVDQEGFVQVGDSVANARVAVLLASRHQIFDMRSGSDLPYEDLHGAPTVLINGVNSFFFLYINPVLPFYLDRDLRIRERGGQGRVWSIAHGPGRTLVGSGSTITEDYPIIVRLFNSKTDGPVIALSGMTTCAVRAAAEFVTDPAPMTKLGSIPRNAWEHKNLELVLHANLINCNPTSVDIVASRSW